DEVGPRGGDIETEGSLSILRILPDRLHPNLVSSEGVELVKVRNAALDHAEEWRVLSQWVGLIEVIDVFLFGGKGVRRDDVDKQPVGGDVLCIVQLLDPQEIGTGVVHGLEQEGGSRLSFDAAIAAVANGAVVAGHHRAAVRLK